MTTRPSRVNRTLQRSWKLDAGAEAFSFTDSSQNGRTWPELPRLGGLQGWLGMACCAAV